MNSKYLIVRYIIVLFLTVCAFNGFAATGKWESKVTGSSISYTVTEAKRAVKDFADNYATIVYLENLNIKKIGRNSNAQDVAWLLAQGFRVIELNYAGNQHTVSPIINADIIAINDSIAKGNFCGYKDCSHYQSYVLFEGYRIALNVPYFKDDPTVYNTPEEYTVGDNLNMDIIYPANPAKAVPVILSFSYSNSYATYDAVKKVLTDENRNQRLKEEYTLAAFNDSFLEGAPANGIAWAIADHPKYCPWAKGKPVNGQPDTYKSYETNPDAARKVKSAVRTLHKLGGKLGLADKIGIFGFSRGSTAGSMAIGDRKIPDIEKAGFNIGVSDKVQAAALGPGVFDYTQIYNSLNDGDANLETRCEWAWGKLSENYAKWQTMGSAYLVQSSATAPVIFFYNTDDDHYYQDQIAHLKAKLDSLQVPTSTLVNYGKGHAIPQTAASLNRLYQFFKQYLKPPVVSR
ncbi:hypothetical protein HH214_05055 [Mucilaginibacter robiniae]|uniref:Alpha/beta hydrolase n=1 Tax=Mucilaginibacter robiniae TaxID=2728022 RepID=A0A7L5E163_9SPHI|nr:hypothetical protein [Mucilaginibacter robiniae]QJD95284.1 hypothetical protein HH214_05055 [Mucilaginibacter robiniae]